MAERNSRRQLEAELAEVRNLAAELVRLSKELAEAKRLLAEGSSSSAEELKAVWVDEYKGSPQFDADLNQTYVFCYKKCHRPYQEGAA